MTDLGLNEHHETVLMNYMKYARFQRTQNLKAVQYSFKDVLDSRLLEDTYTADEVKDILTSLCKVVCAEIESELITTSHMNVLLLKQLFSQAEKWHLRLQPDMSELENKELLDKIKSIENTKILFKQPDTNTTAAKLPPINEGTKSVPLLMIEIERLKSENEKYQETIKEYESQTNSIVFEKLKLKEGLDCAEKELSTLKETINKTLTPSELDEMQVELSKVRSELNTNLEQAAANQQQLEVDLSRNEQKLREVQAQLQLAEDELEKKFSDTVAYSNMKKMLSKKNDQIKELRKLLRKYQPEESLGADE